jgi:hypothetical protein
MRTFLQRSLWIVAFILLSHYSSVAESSSATNVPSPSRWVKPAVEEILPGVWRIRFGSPERFTPDAVRALASARSRIQVTAAANGPAFCARSNPLPDFILADHGLCALRRIRKPNLRLWT